MTITWAKVGLVLSVIVTPVGGAFWLGSIDTKVEQHDKILVDLPSTVTRIDERTIAIQRSIDEIKTQLNKEPNNGRPNQ